MSPTDKAALRAQYRAAREALSPEAWRTRSDTIAARLWEVPEFGRASAVFSYVSSKKNEVDTRPIIVRLVEEGRRIAVPAVAESGTLTWRVIGSLADLKAGRFGIAEPLSTCSPIETFSKEDVVLVPGIAFSRNGHRLGFGGGYFDRFLREFPGTSIGLAFDLQIVAAIPAEEHDVPLDLVVCESAVYRP